MDNDCSKILSLSYRNLTPHLKMCFLYMGVFREDFEIFAKELCSLWVAEGFVNGKSRQFEEDVAEKYLIKLADRNLIMISKRKFDGNIESFRILDLLRDLCVKEAERCNLYEVNIDGVSQNVKEGIRRLALHESDGKSLSPPNLYQDLRTLFDYNLSNMSLVLKYLDVVRVLHMQFPNSFVRFDLVKNMILLRYLKMHRGWTQGAVSVMRKRDISNLSNLQVLNIKSQTLIDLPKGIWELKFLRHIYLRDLGNIPDAQSPHDSLPCLQTLSCILFTKKILGMLSSEKFPNIRKLFLVHGSRKNPLEVSLQSLPKLLHLVALKISHKRRYNRVSGALKVDALPSTLTKIHLESIALSSDLWKLLGELKNLQVLRLSTRRAHATCIEEGFLNQPLVFEAEAVPQLIHLKLRTRHQAIILQDGALRTLQYLSIHPWIDWDSGLLELPDQLWLSTTLKQVKVIEPSDALRNFIQSLDDSKSSKVTLSPSHPCR